MGQNSVAIQRVKELEKLEKRLLERKDFARALERIKKVQAVSELHEGGLRDIEMPTVGTWRLAAPDAEVYITD